MLFKPKLSTGFTNHFLTFLYHRDGGSFDMYNRLISDLIDEFALSFSPMMKTFATLITIEVTTSPDKFQLELQGIRSDVDLKQAFQSETLLEISSRVSEEEYPTLVSNTRKKVFSST